MKKTLCAAVFLLTGFACFSQESENCLLIRELLDDSGLIKNYDAIAQLSVSIETEERDALYQDFAFPIWKKWAGPFGNILPGFGVGSFIQGDKPWAVTSVIMDSVGVTAVYAGAALFFFNLLASPVTILTDSFSRTMDISIGLMTSGLIIAGAARIAGGIRALVYPTVYNDKLRRALNMEDFSLDIQPDITLSGQGLSLTLVHLTFP
jgi:hypothetical protein